MTAHSLPPQNDPTLAPFFDWTGHAGLPAFAAIDDALFEAAFAVAIESHRAEIDAIAGAAEPADFANTIEALERAGEPLSRVSALFWNRAGAHSNDTIQALERVIAPKMSRHASAIAMNAALFARVDALYQDRHRLGLDGEQMRVLERHWKGFVKAGAKLDRAGQDRLAAINEELAALGASFGQNVLADEKSWMMVLTGEDDLTGLPDFVRDAMASAAAERGQEGAHAVTLSRSVIEPFLTFSERRDLREQAYQAWSARGDNGGETDNSANIKSILALRAEKAALLGYPHFAALKLDDTMARTPDAVNGLLETVWEKALSRADRERADLARLSAEAGHNHAIMPWDWRFYAEQLRAEKFDFSEAELKPYLQLERMIAAAFEVARRLFGLTFNERDGIPAYHPDVRVFDVLDASGARIGLFLGDYFARPSKRSGAWMSAFQSQHKLDGGALPISTTS
jgi:peptidyl-dipeptidase Dcp